METKSFEKGLMAFGKRLPHACIDTAHKNGEWPCPSCEMKAPRQAIVCGLFFVVVGSMGTLPYWAAVWFFESGFYYELGPNLRFTLLIDCTELLFLLGPIPCFAAGTVLGLATLVPLQQWPSSANPF